MEIDIAIIGAGPAGLSFARSLADTGLKVCIVEKQSEDAINHPAPDGREIALTHHSYQQLEHLGALQRIASEHISLIKEAKVLDGNSPYALHFDHRKVCNDALGFIISNHHIRKALYEEVKTLSNVDLLFDVSINAISTTAEGASIRLNDDTEINCQLIVAADSRFSESRRKMGIAVSMQEFGRTVIVCKMDLSKSHNNTAYECFRYGNTLAVLPLQDNVASIVVTIVNEQFDGIMAMPASEFNDFVQSQLGHKFGDMSLIGERYHYPLIAVWANHFIAKRFALIGDAAVGMHPVTAHGFNLGLKGQSVLAKLIEQATRTNQDIASTHLLQTYQSKHRLASKPLYLGTNALVKLYTNDGPLPKLIRKAALKFGNRFPPVKNLIMNQLTEVDKQADV